MSAATVNSSYTRNKMSSAALKAIQNPPLLPPHGAGLPRPAVRGPEGDCGKGSPQGREERNGTTTSKTRVHSWCALNVGLGPNFSPSGLRRVRQRGVERDRGLRSQLRVGTWDAQDSTGLAHFDAGVGGPGRLMSTVENPYVQLDPQASSGHPKRSRGERSVILTGGRCGPAFGRKQ